MGYIILASLGIILLRLAIVLALILLASMAILLAIKRPRDFLCLSATVATVLILGTQPLLAFVAVACVALVNAVCRQRGLRINPGQG
ncbi:MAG: hypothetical protein ABF280_00785 [Alteriqipengyuania sp.]|uniref:hypothetical protein n=1 Tax=Alteriqipengyuania sp. TaxID=2800692 RepID=UPI00321A7B25